jgi:sugar phosphate isomerase/epimerase
MTASLDKIQWGFSSLGAPELSLKELSDVARQFKLDFLEVRAVGGTVKLPDYFRDHPELLNTATIKIHVVGTGLSLAGAEDKDFDEFIRFAELAKNWNAPYLRVFGGGKWGDEISTEILVRVTKAITRCRKSLAERGLTGEILLEAHDAFSSGKNCRKLNEQIDQTLGMLWDTHHTWKLSGESAEQTWQEIGPSVKHIHYKDSVTDSTVNNGYRYVVPGQGEFPTADLFRLLAKVGYEAGVSVESEKMWHPTIPEITQILTGFEAVRHMNR